MKLNISQFRPSEHNLTAAIRTWNSDNLSDKEANALPVGSQYYVLYAPCESLKHWHLCLFEIAIRHDLHNKKPYRALLEKKWWILEGKPEGLREK